MSIDVSLCGQYHATQLLVFWYFIKLLSHSKPFESNYFSAIYLLLVRLTLNGVFLFCCITFSEFLEFFNHCRRFRHDSFHWNDKFSSAWLLQNEKNVSRFCSWEIFWNIERYKNNRCDLMQYYFFPGTFTKTCQKLLIVMPKENGKKK